MCVWRGGSGLVPFWHGGQLWHSEEIRPLTGVYMVHIVSSIGLTLSVSPDLLWVHVSLVH